MSGWRTSARVVGDWAAAGRDLVFPPCCAACRTNLDGHARRLCDGCRGALVPVIVDRCRRCSAPVGPHLDTASGCVHCRGEKWKLRRVFSLGPYAERLREACLRLKRPGSEPLAAALAEELFAAWEGEWADQRYDLVVPVPHHWRHRLWRTQQVPVTLARIVGRRLGLPVQMHLVRKVKFTPLQATLSATERRLNLRSAFAPIAGTRLVGGQILVVDDVLTTGTTADRVARVLLELGAESVDAAVIARGLGR
jgi:predicted amidophosphoribosyltransferase